MKKETPFLDFYFKYIKSGKIPEWGLCSCFGNENHLLRLFEPYTGANRALYWAYDGMETDDMDLSNDERHYEFTAMRQTVVLFCAAINGEL